MANNFANDNNCIALYNFESGALTTDSKGSHTLTDNNTVGTETSDYKQGSACADHEESSSEYFSIASDQLVYAEFSICFWAKFESFTQPYLYMFLNGLIVDPNTSFSLYIKNTDYKARFYIGYNGGESVEYVGIHPTVLQTGRWYHFAFTYKQSTKAYFMRIWDDTAESYADWSGTSINTINLEAGVIRIGFAHDGFIDEMVIFDDILTTDEIDEIRQGIYGLLGGSIIPIAIKHLREQSIA